MRVFGWIYIIIFSIGAVLGFVAEFIPGIQKINYIGTPLAILSIVVFILACMGKLKPRKIFFFQSGFIFITVIYVIVLVLLLVIKLGPEEVTSGGITPEVFIETFPWSGPVGWIMVIARLLLSAYGILAYQKAPEAPELPISSD